LGWMSAVGSKGTRVGGDEGRQEKKQSESMQENECARAVRVAKEQ